MRCATSFGVGLLLLISGVWGVYASIVTGRNQWDYYQTRYHADPPLPVGEVLKNAEDAYALWPHNYYFWQYAANRSLTAAFAAESTEECLRYQNRADYWSAAAVGANRYLSNIAYTRAYVLQKSGRLAEAIAVWRDVVDREFWVYDHHKFLCELLLDAGELDAAEGELVWLSWRDRKELKSRLDTRRKRFERFDL